MDVAARGQLSVHTGGEARAVGGAGRAFRRAAGRLHVAGEDSQSDAARRAGEEAAAALVALARDDDAEELGRLLSPDPEHRQVTWTVACYQLGDLTPSALRDFADPVAAVSTLTACPEAAHVAAELVASTTDGLRWTAMTRTHERLAFQLPGFETATDASGEHPGHLAAALGRWRSQLADWAAGRIEIPVATHVPGLVLDAAGAGPAASEAAALAAAVDRAEARMAGLADHVVSRVLDALAHHQVAAAPTINADRAVTARLDAMDERLASLERTIDGIATSLGDLGDLGDRLGTDVAGLREHVETTALEVMVDVRDTMDDVAAGIRAGTEAGNADVRAYVRAAVKVLYEGLTDELAAASDDVRAAVLDVGDATATTLEALERGAAAGRDTVEGVVARLTAMAETQADLRMRVDVAAGHATDRATDASRRLERLAAQLDQRIAADHADLVTLRRALDDVRARVQRVGRPGIDPRRALGPGA